jgi:hypothetical protein
MSCFWTGLCGKIPGLQGHRPDTLIAALQSVNCYTRDVFWSSGEAAPVLLTVKAMQENMEWVKGYDKNAYNNGHDTSICDPFLALVAQVFRLTIHHKYTGYQNAVHSVTYKHKDAVHTVNFHSSTSHFT